MVEGSRSILSTSLGRALRSWSTFICKPVVKARSLPRAYSCGNEVPINLTTAGTAVSALSLTLEDTPALLYVSTAEGCLPACVTSGRAYDAGFTCSAAATQTGDGVTILISRPEGSMATIAEGDGPIAAVALAVTATAQYGAAISLTPASVVIQDADGLPLTVTSRAGTFQVNPLPTTTTTLQTTSTTTVEQPSTTVEPATTVPEVSTTTTELESSTTTTEEASTTTALTSTSIAPTTSVAPTTTTTVLPGLVYEWNFTNADDYYVDGDWWTDGGKYLPVITALPGGGYAYVPARPWIDENDDPPYGSDWAAVFARINSQAEQLVVGDILGGGFTVTGMNHPDAVYGSLYLSPTGGSGSTVMINLSPLSRSGSEGNYVYFFDLTTPCDVKLLDACDVNGENCNWGAAHYTGIFGGAIEWVNGNEPNNYAAFFGPQIGMSNTSETTFSVWKIALAVEPTTTTAEPTTTAN